MFKHTVLATVLATVAGLLTLAFLKSVGQHNEAIIALSVLTIIGMVLAIYGRLWELSIENSARKREGMKTYQDFWGDEWEYYYKRDFSTVRALRKWFRR